MLGRVLAMGLIFREADESKSPSSLPVISRHICLVTPRHAFQVVSQVGRRRPARDIPSYLLSDLR
jgi:hypothetical protein